MSEAQPVLEELMALDRRARALDPDAAAALLLTYAGMLGANLIRVTHCGTWAGTYTWACLTTLLHILRMRIRAQTLAPGRARACVMASRTRLQVFSLLQTTASDVRTLGPQWS